jgi:hypothetical protein
MKFNLKTSLPFAALPVAVLLVSALASTPSNASDFFCNNYIAADHPAHYQCVQTNVGPGAVTLISPDQAGGAPLYAASVSVGSGPFAATSSANAYAEPGLLRAFTSSAMLAGSIDNAQSTAVADAWFADGGSVVGGSGAAIGSSVLLRFTVDLSGSFSGGGLFTALSEATVDFVLGQPGGTSFQTRAQADKFNPSRLVTYDVRAAVGDSFEMIVKLHAAASAINNANPANTQSVANVSHTSHLYVDVLAGNAKFIGSGGHDYASLGTTPPVPEPSETALMLLGLTCIAALMRQRQRAAR